MECEAKRRKGRLNDTKRWKIDSKYEWRQNSRRNSQYLHLIQWQVQRNASGRLLSISQIAQETDQRVQAHHERHAEIKYARAAEEMRWRFHVVLERHDHADALQRKDDRAKEHGQFV